MRTDFANHLQTVRIARRPATDFIEVFGAPEEIRTPDPQIRSLVQVIENTHVFSKFLCLVLLNFNGLGLVSKPKYST